MDQKAYRKLIAWQRGMDLVEEIYRIATALPNSEKYNLVSQLQRAAVSVPANIAEGYGRTHRGDYLRHLSIARGSLMELETHLTIAVRLNLLDRETAIPAWQLAQETGKLLTAMIKRLERSTTNPSP